MLKQSFIANQFESEFAPKGKIIYRIFLKIN